MYETRSVRPYYTIPHLGCFGAPFKKLIGFEYKKTIYTTSSEMNNIAYFEEKELQTATAYFAKLWEDKRKVKKLIQEIRARFQEATKAEQWAWTQDWSKKSTEQLLLHLQKMYQLLHKVFVTMLVSQPQHVLPLDDTIMKLLEKYKNKDELLRAATYFPGKLPWDDENKEIEQLHKIWKTLSKIQQEQELERLVKIYGWFNAIEGDKPFDKEHYQKKILAYESEKKYEVLKNLEIPEDVLEVGQLIGELGFLRFWNRYHFMHVRYHIKQILAELMRRKGIADLEYATVEEVLDIFHGKKIALEEIKKRKQGYISILDKGRVIMLIGEKAEKYSKLIKEEFRAITTIKGRVANKGKAVGKVRIISFSAKDYNEQVAAFQKGEILVTGMTRPQIVHLCGKAAAIITDEGGITSHAAVVSRELNVPCIIGTHIATKILKTGDKVEVDATNDREGVVRIIQ